MTPRYCLMSTARTRWWWLVLTAIALLWPGRLAAPLDGAPLDTIADALALGLAFPLLLWIHPRYLASGFARGCVVSLLALKLCAKYERDARISVVAAALSDRNGDARFEINRSEASSSLLPIDPRNSEWFARDLSVANAIIVPTIKLSELMTREKLEAVDLLKLDLQGAERLVLSSAAEVLDRVRVIYTEVFFERLYENAWLFGELNEFLSGHDFKLCGLANIVHATNGDLVQANATFRRNDLLSQK